MTDSRRDASFDVSELGIVAASVCAVCPPGQDRPLTCPGGLPLTDRVRVATASGPGRAVVALPVPKAFMRSWCQACKSGLS